MTTKQLDLHVKDVYATDESLAVLDNHFEINQLDGNDTFSDVSSSEVSSFNLSNNPENPDDSLAGFNNLSTFLPYANHDITYDELTLGDSYFTQPGDNSNEPDTLETPGPTLPIPLNNKTKTALSLPSIMVTNHRSIFPKFNSLVDELLECDVKVCLHSEIREDKEKNEHKEKIEEALELHGILYISNPRPKRRGSRYNSL